MGEKPGKGQRKDERVARGGCLCGAVRYAVYGPLRGVVACHCGQCQRSHGGFGSYTVAKRADFELLQAEDLRWYSSSEFIRRGFCGNCGGRLFWEDTRRDSIAITAGSLEPPTGLRTVLHIFTANKPDYYEITDDLEQLPQGAGAGGVGGGTGS